MINKIVDSVLPNYSEKRRYEICEFLKTQEINEKNTDTISSCLFVIQKFYEEIANLRLIFDENSNIDIMKTEIVITREHISELNMFGLDAIEEIKHQSLKEMIEKIKELSIFKENFIITNGNFLSFSVIDEDTYQPKICIAMNCKVLNVKEIRKLKLDNINQSKNYQFLQ